MASITSRNLAPIAIVGGGPCGLTFARLLEQYKLDYVVFERDLNATPTSRYQGGTLDIHGPSGQQALKEAGLFQEFSALARWDATRLRNMLLDSIPAHKIRWGHGVKAVESKSGTAKSAADWVIRFINGTSASGFRLVVGADGAWSKVRSLLTSAKPEYSGKIFIEGRIPQGNPSYTAAKELAGPGNMLAMGKCKTLAVQQVADSSYRLYMGMKAPEDRFPKAPSMADTEAMRQEFLASPEYYADWAPELKQYLSNAEGPFRLWPLHRLPVSSLSWERVPGVTLVGDAAHVSTPLAGEGVNMAMHDALKLTKAITKHCDVGSAAGEDEDASILERALAEYEKDMFERAQDHTTRCIDREGMFFADDSAQQLIDMITGAL
ncbi:Monooxygenase FAD-binding [Fusarium albosuccineum]|uniref:Monooxygenase FAD-binding n=1 Tax=Fusarium albosuccineum TaxID=1237068 RepID=A0A8H4LHY8_9HYPO|nr:Monooxygenase FAD-binding [Fusarium albosuccineum]